MQTKTYIRNNPDGSITTVPGNCLIDHIHTTTKHAKAIAVMLANQDRSAGELPVMALQLNLDIVERLCELIDYMLPFAVKK